MRKEKKLRVIITDNQDVLHSVKLTGMILMIRKTYFFLWTSLTERVKWPFPILYYGCRCVDVLFGCMCLWVYIYMSCRRMTCLANELFACVAHDAWLSQLLRCSVLTFPFSACISVFRWSRWPRLLCVEVAVTVLPLVPSWFPSTPQRLWADRSKMVTLQANRLSFVYMFVATGSSSSSFFSHASGMALWIAMLVGLSVWSRLKYLNNYRMDCHEILYRHSWSPENKFHWLWQASYLSTLLFSSSTTMRLTFLVFNEISQQLLNGLPWILVQISMVPIQWILMTLVIFSFRDTSR